MTNIDQKLWWQTYAACGRPDVEPSWWDIQPGMGYRHSVENRLAVKACLNCPVLKQCHADAEAQRAADRMEGVIRAGYAYTPARVRDLAAYYEGDKNRRWVA